MSIVHGRAFLCLAVLTACGGGDASPPPPAESCELLGDEDGNGLADCADPACADAIACQPRCGNGQVEASETCDDGNAAGWDGCTSRCAPSAPTYIKASNTEMSDFFGFAVALSADGSTLAVGAMLEASAATGIDGNQADNSAANAGAVYVYARSGATWVQQAYLKASNTGLGDVFSFAVALSADGSTLAVGAPNEDSAATGIGGDQADNSIANAGAVYVFVRSGAAWTQQAYVKASNSGASDGFGGSVALSADGSTLAVGASGEASAATGVDGNQADDTAAGAGAVYVLARTGTTWTQQAYVKASNTGAGDRFGDHVALSADGSTLAVAARSEDSAATGIDGTQADDSLPGSGAVYVFVRSGATWSQQAYVKASNTGAGDAFGASLALSADGSTLAVGATNESSAATGVGGNQADNSVSGAGAAYVFVRNGLMWSQQAYLKASNTGLGDVFGADVALSDDGSTLAAAALSEDCAATGVGGDQASNAAFDAGAVYMFARTGEVWTQRVYLKASNAGSGDGFGGSLGLSGDGSILAVGATGESSRATGIDGNQADNSLVAAGAAYVYH